MTLPLNERKCSPILLIQPAFLSKHLEISDLSLPAFRRPSSSASWLAVQRIYAHDTNTDTRVETNRLRDAHVNERDADGKTRLKYILRSDGNDTSPIRLLAPRYDVCVRRSSAQTL